MSGRLFGNEKVLMGRHRAHGRQVRRRLCAGQALHLGASSASAAAFDTALAGLDMLASRKVVAVRSPDRGMGEKVENPHLPISQVFSASPQGNRRTS